MKFTDAKPDCNGENSALEKLEKMITEKFVKEQETMKESITALEKKLRRKQNENQNLIDNIEKLTKAELDRVSDIYDLKETLRKRDEECLRLSDDLAVKTKEQLENIRVKDLEGELDDVGLVSQQVLEQPDGEGVVAVPVTPRGGVADHEVQIPVAVEVCHHAPVAAEVIDPIRDGHRGEHPVALGGALVLVVEQAAVAGVLRGADVDVGAAVQIKVQHRVGDVSLIPGRRLVLAGRCSSKGR